MNRVLASLFIFSLCFSLTVFLYSCRESLDERIIRETESFNKRSCPKQVDKFVTLDSISYIINSNSANEYKYSHSVNCDTAQMEFLKEHGNGMKTEILKRIRNAQDLRLIKEAGITISYVFYQSETKDTIYYFKYPRESYQD